MPKINCLLSRLSILLFSFLFSGAALFAQLNADFQMDLTGGCSPLTVNFTNTSKGASSNATFSWDFGNGNTSSLLNAGATYVLPNTYTITLTVNDGTKTSTKSKQVTVYKKPTLDFSFDVSKGCLPQLVSFTAKANSGDGNITNYFWDFGDGNTQQGLSLQNPQHTYNFSLNSSVGLTVTNSYGCYSYIQRPATQVLPAIKAAFSVDKSVLCNISDPVTFTNASTGPGTLSYNWDFGDGNSSTALNPTHIYNKIGTYTVNLIVTSSEGCSNTAIQLNYVNVRNYSSDFDIPALICASNNIAFTDKSTPVADSKIWLVDNNYQCGWCSNVFNYSFNDTLSHTIKLINSFGTCNDTISKIVTAHAVPPIKPFIITIPPNCGAPVTVGFKDTTSDVAKWLWEFECCGSSGPSASSQSSSYNYTGNWVHDVKLTVTNKAGCAASELQTVYTGPVNVSIGLLNTGHIADCDSVPMAFTVYASDSVTSYHWDFGDGVTSINPQPQHTFIKEGVFNVILTYVTKNGCTGTAIFPGVTVAKHHPSDFTASATTVCGNTPVTFTMIDPGIYNSFWDFGDNDYYFGAPNNTGIHQYQKDSVFTVSVRYFTGIYGMCEDTIIKKDYIKVLPPFPKINHITNTCDGDRNLVTFTDTSYKALTWDWDFGDGSPHVSYNAHQPQVTHVYAQTGAYKAVLTNSNGQCTVRDSSMVYVLLKQLPVLYSDVSSTCSSGPIVVSLKNMETNPAPWAYFWYANFYNLYAMQYGDSTSYAYNGYPFQNGAWQNTTNWTVAYLDPTKKDLRIISNSAYFGCNDTSNFIPLKINGPKAGFKLADPSPCLRNPVIAVDTSIASANATIASWNWTFGDGSTVTETKSVNEAHLYTSPGQYLVNLTVTDINGCKDQTTYNLTHYAYPSGPQAAFTYSPAIVTPGTPVAFANNTNTFSSSGTQYQWLFGDGSSTTDYSPNHTFNAVGVYTVKLIASNPTTGCHDTSIQVITVRAINTQFGITKSYVSSSSCPPVIVHFSNTSSNAISVSWDFGDGSKADNQNNPSHTYYNAGTYIITMYGYGYNGTKDTTLDSIIIKAPSAKLSADAFFGCLSKIIRLDAQVHNANFFVWDFGDGQVQETKDSFSTHPYLTPGIYSPNLIMYDSSGCALQSYLQQKIVIDSLGIAIKKTPAQLCGLGPVDFQNPVISSFAQQMQVPLQYHWDFGTGNAADSSNTANTSFSYNTYGTKLVNLTVQSPYGCVKHAVDSIKVVPLSIASIGGPQNVCEKTAIQFNGNASISDSTSWYWNFGNGNTAVLQNPGLQNFPDTGSYNIYLVTNHFGCLDTARSQLFVHGNPVIGASPQKALVCLGNSIQLNTHVGYSYSWYPANGLNNNSSATPLATPTDDVMYVVTASNSFGCTNKDSIKLTVLKPFTIKVPADTFVCLGSSVMLPVTGAYSYNWIYGVGLNDSHSSKPVATPANPGTYTVVGYDLGNCFTDTATVKVDVKPLPFINAGPDITVLTGTAVQLNAISGQGITIWKWSPADGLSCVNCPSPIATPKRTTAYIVQATNQYGCTAADTVFVKLICDQNRLRIPNAFTPDNNGKNDVFYVKGTGASLIKSFRIYGRWGEIVFEKQNVYVDDRSAGWDGNINGKPAPPGGYVYMVELVCDTGELFELKGSVLLLR
jgi:gliding motility-associated-like protein